jgi:O-antigen ligase
MLTSLAFAIAALVLAAIAIIAMLFAIRAASRWSGLSISFLLLLMTGTSIIRESFTPKPLYMLTEGDSGGPLISKLFLLLIISYSFILCVTRFVAYDKNLKTFSRASRNRREPPNDIIIAFMAFYVSFSIIPIFFGKEYYFHINMIYPFFTYLALFLWSDLSSIDPIIVVKQSLGLIVFSSLIVAAVAPDLAMDLNYNGLIPGFSSRLYGMTSSTNTMGAVACTLLVIEVAEPSARAWLGRSILVAAGSALLMSQSKTSILSALIAILIIYGWRMFSKILGESAGSRHKNSTAVALIIVVSVSISVAGTWAMAYDWDALSSLQRKINSSAIADISTATGRTIIWSAAIAGGMENPFFGQGANFWNLDYRLRSGLSGAVHAHNLFLQTFTISGFVGLLALLLFLFFLGLYTIRAAKTTRGGSIAFMVIFFIRSLTEVPLQPNTIIAGESFAMIAYFLYVMDRGCKLAKKTKTCDTME